MRLLPCGAILLAACGCGARAAAAPNNVLSDSIAQLRRTANATRVGRVDVLLDPASNRELAVCHVPLISSMRVRAPILQIVMAARIAIEHLNTGDGSIVPALAGLNERCDIRFTTENLESTRQPSSAVRAATSVLDDACAIATVPDKDTVPVAVLSGAAGVPHLSPVAGSDELSMKDIYPTFARTSTSDLARMSIFVDYLCHEVGTRHLILLHEQIPAKVSRASSLLQSAAASCPDMKVMTIGVPGTKAISDEDAARVLDDIEESGYRHIFSLAAKEQLYRLLELGVDRGLAANPDYFWSANVPKHDPAAEGSNLERALRGLASIELNENIAGVPYQKFDEVFLCCGHSVNATS